MKIGKKNISTPALASLSLTECLLAFAVSLVFYLDDVIDFYSSLEQHLEDQDAVLSKLGQDGLNGQNGKCSFFRHR